MPEIHFRNKKLFYRVYGQGTPVVLLHGFGETGDVWNRQIKALESNYKLIVPDLPGSGKSEALDHGFTIDDLADTTKAIVDYEERNNKFHLFGHSMGGYTTMAFAEKYEDRLLSYGLVHSSSYPDTEEKKEVRKKGIEFIRKNGGFTFLKTITPGLFSETSQQNHPEYITELLSLATGITDETLIGYYEAMMRRPDRSEVLAKSHVPVLFIIGKYDGVVPLELSLRQAALPAKTTSKILEKTAHMGMWEEEELTGQALTNFLENSRRV